MSLEMLVFLEKSHIPDRRSFQSAVESMGIPLQLSSTLDLTRDRGFSPSSIKGISSGFEIDSQSSQEILERYPGLKRAVGDRDWAISFRWGSSMSECACALAASATLVKLCGAVAYYPADSLTYDLEGLLNEIHSCLKRV
jgi:hypothetical protein